MKAWRAVLVLLLCGLAVGLGLGFLLGWGVWPVEYYDTDPVDLKEEHKEDYIVLVSATYALNGDLSQAKDRLDKLEGENVAQLVADVAQRYLERGEDSATTRNLVMLADALGTSTEAMVAYVATSTPTLVPTFTPTATEVPTETPTETPSPTYTSTAVPPTSTSTRLPPTRTSTAAPPTNTVQPAPTSTPTATTQAAAGCPGRWEPALLDIDRNRRDWGWVQEHFGLTRDYLMAQASSCPGGRVYSIVELAQYTDMTLRVTVQDRYGSPKPGVQVAFFGFEPSVETPGGCCGRKSVAHMEITNERGEATYNIYGSVYWPDQGEKGYHAVWVVDSISSDCADGLGWVGRTFHDHLNVTFREIG